MIATIVPLIEQQAWSVAAAHTDPTKAPVQACSGRKRRRLDEDLKRAMCYDMIEQKRARNVSDAVASVGGVSRKNAQGWIVRELLRYQAAAWKLCSDNMKALSISIDGKRVGQPAEETEAAAAWCFPANLAFWLPPMVPTGKGAGGRVCLRRWRSV